MEPVNIALYWDNLTLQQATLPAHHVKQGERVHVMMPEKAQQLFLDMVFRCPLSQDDTLEQHVWLSNGGQKVLAGSDAFCRHLACMLRQRGLLANLTLKENLLLPFLYADRKEDLKHAEKALMDVVEFLDMQDKLDEKAGERPPYIHALISLGHCLLKKPSIVVAQDVHWGMTEEHSQRFQRKMLCALKTWNPGILYLSSAVPEHAELPFQRTCTLEGDVSSNMEWS